MSERNGDGRRGGGVLPFDDDARPGAGIDDQHAEDGRSGVELAVDGLASNTSRRGG